MARQADLTPPHDESPAIPRYAWVILFTVFLASVAAPLNMYKVPPLMPVLKETFQLDLGQAGLLMSVFSITGLILALPTAFALQKLGFKVIGIAALVSLIAGASMGAMGTTNNVLLISRVIEGVGMGLITVVAPAIIAAWFPREKQGIPMGIWATWVPVGNVLMYVLGPGLNTAFGWQAVWWAGAGFALAALILFVWLMRMPTQDESGTYSKAGSDRPTAQTTLKSVFANRNIWLLALSFGSFNLVFIATGTFFPTFFAEERGYSLEQASLIASISTFAILVSAPLAGWVSDRIGSRKWLIVIPSLVTADMMLWPFTVTGWVLYAFMASLGFVAGAVPTATFAAVPEVMERPQLTGLGMAVLSAGQNSGMVIGPVLFGWLVESLDWVTAGYWMIPICVLALVAAMMIKVR
jgi:MFS family permease